MKKFMRYIHIVLFVILAASTSIQATTKASHVAYSGEHTYVVEDAIFIGDRLTHIAHALGIVPRVMSVRASQWPGAYFIPAKIIGCPTKVTIKDKALLPKIVEQMNLKKVIAESNPQFCLLYKQVNPQNFPPLPSSLKVEVIKVPTSDDFEATVHNVARVFSAEKKASKLLEKYRKEMALADKRLAKAPRGKKVVVLNGMVSQKSGRVFLTVEAKGYYTDRYFLTPLGAENVGDLMKSNEAKISKGTYAIKDLSGLLKAQPDVIIVRGNGIQESIIRLLNTHPEAAAIPALKDRAIFNLPYYVGSDGFNYPAYLIQWINTFSVLN